MVAFYAPIILQKAGFSSPSMAIGSSVFMFLSTLVWVAVAYALVDRLGRRALLLMGAVTMGFGLTMLALILNFGWSPYYALGAIVFILAASNLSRGPLGWVVLGEIFPTRIRAKAMSIATFFLWLSMFVSVQFVPAMLAYFERKYGSGAPTFLIFAVICALAYLFVWRMLPETKGRTLEEIAHFWLAAQGGLEH